MQKCINLNINFATLEKKGLHVPILLVLNKSVFSTLMSNQNWKCICDLSDLKSVFIDASPIFDGSLNSKNGHVPRAQFKNTLFTGNLLVR